MPLKKPDGPGSEGGKFAAIQYLTKMYPNGNGRGFISASKHFHEPEWMQNLTPSWMVKNLIELQYSSDQVSHNTWRLRLRSKPEEQHVFIVSGLHTLHPEYRWFKQETRLRSRS